jgi:hypothetical protein
LQLVQARKRRFCEFYFCSQCEILAFLRGVVEVFVLPGRCGAYVFSWALTFRDNSIPIFKNQPVILFRVLDPLILGPACPETWQPTANLGTATFWKSEVLFLNQNFGISPEIWIGRFRNTSQKYCVLCQPMCWSDSPSSHTECVCNMTLFNTHENK